MGGLNRPPSVNECITVQCSRASSHALLSHLLFTLLRCVRHRTHPLRITKVAARMPRMRKIMRANGWFDTCGRCEICNDARALQRRDDDDMPFSTWALARGNHRCSTSRPRSTEFALLRGARVGGGSRCAVYETMMSYMEKRKKRSAPEFAQGKHASRLEDTTRGDHRYVDIKSLAEALHAWRVLRKRERSSSRRRDCTLRTPRSGAVGERLIAGKDEATKQWTAMRRPPLDERLYIFVVGSDAVGSTRITGATMYRPISYSRLLWDSVVRRALVYLVYLTFRACSSPVHIDDIQVRACYRETMLLSLPASRAVFVNRPCCRCIIFKSSRRRCCKAHRNRKYKCRGGMDTQVKGRGCLNIIASLLQN